MAKGVIKQSVNLQRDVVDAIKQMASGRGLTMTEVIRDAIGTEKFIYDQKLQGAKVLIEYPDGKIIQVVFR
jgi:hypothetical protein